MARAQAWPKEGAAAEGGSQRPALISVHKKGGEWRANLPAMAARVQLQRQVTNST